MSTTFNESDHPRSEMGRFATKAFADSEASLDVVGHDELLEARSEHAAAVEALDLDDPETIEAWRRTSALMVDDALRVLGSRGYSSVTLHRGGGVVGDDVTAVSTPDGTRLPITVPSLEPRTLDDFGDEAGGDVVVDMGRYNSAYDDVPDDWAADPAASAEAADDFESSYVPAWGVPDDEPAF